MLQVANSSTIWSFNKCFPQTMRGVEKSWIKPTRRHRFLKACHCGVSLFYLLAFGHLDRKPPVEPCPVVLTPGDDASRWSGASWTDHNTGVEQGSPQIPARWDLSRGLCPTHPEPRLWAFGPNNCSSLNMRTKIQDVRILITP